MMYDLTFFTLDWCEFGKISTRYEYAFTRFVLSVVTNKDRQIEH